MRQGARQARITERLLYIEFCTRFEAYFVPYFERCCPSRRSCARVFRPVHSLALLCARTLFRQMSRAQRCAKFDSVPKFDEYIGRYIIATYDNVLEFFLATLCPLKGCIHPWA